MLFFEALKLGYLIHLHPLDNAHAEHTTSKSPVTRVRDKDCVKNRVKRAKIVRFTLC